MESISKIRKMYHVDGKAIRAIAKELNISKNTVKNVNCNELLTHYCNELLTHQTILKNKMNYSFLIRF
ncbi:hypothetical protein [Candidatus Tisiphia endosymbiont of Ditula angustiorana]|uniref:hypothetical protein n=1 Tax=Candidatus Tisiphia endosymbiont of Ditula angustiorana TaxID=3066272 RepID=UPI00312C9779